MDQTIIHKNITYQTNDSELKFLILLKFSLLLKFSWVSIQFNWRFNSNRKGRNLLAIIELQVLNLIW